MDEHVHDFRRYIVATAPIHLSMDHIRYMVDHYPILVNVLLVNILINFG